ncbi:hypothetical protein N752_28515 [Desulforamulus aquiferis]|nr:hypothetical protein N752_28515 [Desulforamulus aquiferis]
MLEIAMLPKEEGDAPVFSPEAALADNPNFTPVEHQDVQEQGGTQLPS